MFCFVDTNVQKFNLNSFDICQKVETPTKKIASKILKAIFDLKFEV